VDKTPERPLDQYLVLLSQAGSTDAMDGLARRWTPRLLRYAMRVLGRSPASAETARDVVQETWVGAIRGLPTLRDPAQFPAWIYGIATRKCADAIRTNIRRRRLDAHSALADGSPRPATVGVEHQIDLATGIQQLPPKQRAVVHLFYVEELTVEEIATAMRIPSGTVKSRLHHAREALKRNMHVGSDVEARQESESGTRRTS
jgi:RNA polymerase sigma factor (sigma-70 family)